MADASIDLQATNLFNLGATFKTSASGVSDPTTNAQNLDALGNVSCERNIIDITSYTQSAGYCGSDFDTDLGTIKELGVQNSIAVTSYTINMTAGEYCTVDIEGHNHDANAHTALVNIAALGAGQILSFSGFNNWDGFGVPSTAANEYFGITCTNASPASATLTVSVNHIDQIAEDGTHLVGTNTLGRSELTVEFSGSPDGPTLAGIQAEVRALGGTAWGSFLVDSIDASDSNSDFDTFSFTGHNNHTLS